MIILKLRTYQLNITWSYEWSLNKFCGKNSAFKKTNQTDLPQLLKNAPRLKMLLKCITFPISLCIIYISINHFNLKVSSKYWINSSLCLSFSEWKCSVFCSIFSKIDAFFCFTVFKLVFSYFFFCNLFFRFSDFIRFFLVFSSSFRGVFRTQSSSYGRPFCKNSEPLFAVNYFRKKSSILENRIGSKCAFEFYYLFR